MLKGPLRFFLPVPFLVWFCLAASPPGILAGDAGELTAAAYSFGPAHPPGYPLYVLLGRLFLLVPVGGPAWRLTLLSCLALAFSYPLAASALERILRGRPASTGIAAFLSFFILTGPIVLAQVQGPEVYALLFLSSAALLFLAVQARPAFFLLLFFAAALALVQHYLAVLAVPVLLLAWKGRRPEGKRWVLGTAFALVGLTPFLLLPLRAHLEPVANWGDPDNLTRFLKHVMRSQYVGTGSGHLFQGWDHLLHYWRIFIAETWFLGVLAIVAVSKKTPAAWVVAAVMQLFVLPILLLIEPDPVSHAVIDAYFPPVVLWCAPLMALGAAGLLGRAGSGRRKRLLVVVLTLLTLLHAVWAIRRSDASENLVEERMGRNVLLNLPRGAELHSRGDFPTFPLFYLKTVFFMRRDTFILDLDGGVFTDHRRTGGTLLPGRRSFFTEVGGVPGRIFEPAGLLFVSGDPMGADWERGYWRRAVEPGALIREDYFTRSEAGNHHLFKGWWLLREGDEAGARREFSRMKDIAGRDRRLLTFLGVLYLQQGWIGEAEELYAGILRTYPRDTEAAFKLGALSEESGRKDMAEIYYRRCLAADPRRTDARNNLAVLLLGQGRAAEAVVELERLLQEDPKNADAVKNLALALWEKDLARAKALLRRYLFLRPDAPDRKAVEATLQ